MAVETPLKYSAFWAGKERRGHMSKVEEYIISIPDVKLLEGLGAKVVKVVCLLELKGLHGRDRLAGYPTETVVAYEGK